jgi:hypothetical protein
LTDVVDQQLHRLRGAPIAAVLDAHLQVAHGAPAWIFDGDRQHEAPGLLRDAVELRRDPSADPLGHRLSHAPQEVRHDPEHQRQADTERDPLGEAPRSA